MKEQAKFELLSIDIDEEYFLKKMKPSEVPNSNDYEWKYHFKFDFLPYKEGFDLVIVNMSFDLLLSTDLEADPITYLSLRNSFRVTSNLSNAGKVKTLLIFIDMTNCNIQGIVAERYNDTLMSQFIPPQLAGTDFSEELLNTVINEWKF